MLTKFGIRHAQAEEDPPTEASYVMVHRTTSQSFEIQIKPSLRPTDRRRAEELADLSNALLAHSDLIVRHDRSGNYLGVRGLDIATQSVLDVFPIALKPAFEPLVKMSASQFEDRWRGRYSIYLGRDFEVGSSYSGAVTMPLPGGRKAAATLQMSVTERGVVRGVDCVRLISGYFSTDQAFGDLMRSLTSSSVQSMLSGMTRLGQIDETKRKSAVGEMKRELPTFIVQKVTVGNDRVLDPRTMVTYAEEDRIRFDGTAKDALGKVETVRVDHITEYEYQFQK
jgi:hypothetical protein